MNRFAYIGLVLATTFLMGVAFPVGKIGLLYSTPFLLMGIRFVLAGGGLALFTAKRRQPRGLRQWLQAAVVGLFQSAGTMGCAYYSMRWITSAESAILTFMNPLLVVILGTVFAGARYRPLQWLGTALGFAGVAFSFGFQVGFNTGTFIGFAGAVCFAAATLLIKRWGPGFDLTVFTAYQMLIGGFILLLLSALTEHPYFEWNASSVTVLLWLASMCSIVQFSGWFYLLKNGDPGKTSALLFLAPIFGVLSSWVLLGEKVYVETIAGGLLVCIGIFFVNWEGRPQAWRTKKLLREAR
ncbi:DMT family transporter [Paenibacillus chartarius]|uniref:DMT family transporter n=1 Tax=Paenibacillus chartarius TaxID=747481 RepID=A0ABV6DUD9_9BACL